MKLPIIFYLLIHCSIISIAQDESEYRELREAINMRQEYDQQKTLRLKKLHELYKQTDQTNNELMFLVLQQLSNEYKTYIYDSAFHYVRKLQQIARRIKDPVKIAYAKNQLGLVLLSSGMFKETLDSLQNSRMDLLPDSIQIDYYAILARAYYDLGDFDKDKYYTPKYTRLGNACIDSAMALCKPASYSLIYLRGLRNIKNGNMPAALKDLTTLLQSHQLDDHQVAVTASTLSSYYISINDEDEAISLLIKAAIADARSSTKETSAMSTLAELLYKKGDIQNAYICIQQAMDDATFYGARQRKIQVGSILPVIASAKLNNVEEQRKIWLIYSAIITVLSILVLIFVIMISKELKRRKAAELALQEANKIKEEYIGYFFNINSEYLGKIETFKRSIEMKLLTRKLEDIKFIVNGINLKKEREELYHGFDKVFLKLFPDFIIVFNSFFKDEDKIVLKEGQLLNTELRIFALIRLGINDTEKIARILDYSISTIYNYKTRIKSKSLVPNESFEKKIMEIQG
jgi:tetratricopeptide (TPR) repeat protein